MTALECTGTGLRTWKNTKQILSWLQSDITSWERSNRWLSEKEKVFRNTSCGWWSGIFLFDYNEVNHGKVCVFMLQGLSSQFFKRKKKAQKNEKKTHRVQHLSTMCRCFRSFLRLFIHRQLLQLLLDVIHLLVLLSLLLLLFLLLYLLLRGLIFEAFLRLWPFPPALLGVWALEAARISRLHGVFPRFVLVFWPGIIVGYTGKNWSSYL